MNYPMYPPEDDEAYQARLEISRQGERIKSLEAAVPTAKKKHTLDILFNALCACHARVAAVTLTHL